MSTLDDLYGIITNPYPDIPSEYQLGLDRGKLGDWLQEIYDAGWDVEIVRADPEYGQTPCVVIVRRGESLCYEGEDRDTHRVDVMVCRAYLAWKGREG